jgi:hypothetical protein
LALSQSHQRKPALPENRRMVGNLENQSLCQSA